MWQSLHHQVDARFAYPKDDQTLVVRLRTGRGFARRVSVVYGDRYTPPTQDMPVEMTWVGHDALFDYWQADLSVPSRRVRYVFLVEADGERRWYGEQGLAFSRQAAGAFHYPYIHRGSVIRVPDWVSRGIVYQIFPDRYAKGDPSIDPEGVESWGQRPTPTSLFGGDLQGIIDHLDDLADLGVNVLYLTPIFASPSNHKYDTSDYYRVDPHFGSEETLRTLVDEAHRRGMKVMLDAVFNHSGYDFFAFQDVRARGKRSPYWDWFFIDGEAVRTTPKPNYETFANDVWTMPKLNTGHPDVAQYLLGVAKYWTEKADIDGWRLDVANEVSPDFWRAFRREVKAIKPEALIIGEIWHDALPWVSGDLFDGVMNYVLREAMVDFFAKGTIRAATFAERLVNMQMRYPEPVNRMLWNLLDSHDTERFITTAGGDERLLRLALMFLMTFPGMPLLYYGTEIGMEGGGDPDCRRTYPWDQRPKDRPLYRYTKRLIELRKAHVAFQEGEFGILYADESTNVLVYKRAGVGGDSTTIILLNRGSALHTYTLPLQKALDIPSSSNRATVPINVKVLFGSEHFRSLNAFKDEEKIDAPVVTIALPPLEGAIISLSEDKGNLYNR